MADRSDIVLAEHIDVMLLGAADRLVRLLYEPVPVTAVVSNPSHSGYLNHLKAVLRTSLDLRTKNITKPHVLHLGNITKLSHSLLTKSLWLGFHFHYPNHQFYDVFVSDFIRGNCNIAVVVEEEGQGFEELQQLMKGHPDSQLRYDNKQIPATSKNETFYENRVLARGHRAQLAQFEHILTLKAIGSTLMEARTNQPMSIKQVLRWIVERHFEQAHHVQLSKALGDEIEHNRNEQPQKCTLI